MHLLSADSFLVTRAILLFTVHQPPTIPQPILRSLHCTFFRYAAASISSAIARHLVYWTSCDLYCPYPSPAVHPSLNLSAIPNKTTTMEECWRWWVSSREDWRWRRFLSTVLFVSRSIIIVGPSQDDVHCLNKTEWSTREEDDKAPSSSSSPVHRNSLHLGLFSVGSLWWEGHVTGEEDGRTFIHIICQLVPFKNCHHSEWNVNFSLIGNSFQIGCLLGPSFPRQPFIFSGDRRLPIPLTDCTEKFNLTEL